MTKAGIEHDLKSTPYLVEIVYNDDLAITFYFSSSSALNKFAEGIENNRETIAKSLTNRFKMKFKIAQSFCDVCFYKVIERRGYLIKINGEMIEWPAQIAYDGTKIYKIS